jgi:hypothetical protein
VQARCNGRVLWIEPTLWQRGKIERGAHDAYLLRSRSGPRCNYPWGPGYPTRPTEMVRPFSGASMNTSM